MLAINRSIPLYMQLYRILQASIEKGEYPVGTMLPSERQLVVRHAIQRATVRKSLARLEADGYIVSRRGIGYTVVSRLGQPIRSQPVGFTEAMLGQGVIPSSRILRCDVISADPEVARRLDVRAAQPVVRLERLRLANGVYVGLELAYLRYPLCESILNVDLVDDSLYRSLNDRLGIRLCYVDDWISVIETSNAEWELLALDPRSLVVCRMRTAVDHLDRVVEFTRALYCDRWFFSSRLFNN